MPADPIPAASCPVCGGPLDASLAVGGCVACLWGDLIAGEKDEQAALKDAPVVEGYTVLEEIGRGGMGVVYKARQENPPRLVALKIVAPFSLQAVQERLRFMVEIEAMAAVSHAALLPLYETGEDSHGRPWFTMQLAAGGTLAGRIKSFKGDWRRSASLMVTLSGAVQYAHERGILHRDLKPANVLFDDRDNAYVADFGLAKWAEADADLTQSSQLLGSPAYLAPEAAAGGARATTTASDVYGLGTILYELLTSHQPYRGSSAAHVLTQILAQPPPPPRQLAPDIPRDLEVITLKALHRDPARRYPTAAALAEDVTRWLEGKPIEARPVSPLERGIIWARRNPAPAALSLLLLASITTGGILLWRANQRLTASLDDAENRVEFMTRELPVKLAPMGRLDLLDDVFKNVAEHYQVSTRTDAEGLARQADFLTQWAQILRPRGQNVEAVARLRQAVEKALAATAGKNPPIAAGRARVASGWRLGEALIEGKKQDEAESVLTDAAAYAAGQDQADEKLRILDAQITLEKAYLARSRRDMPQVKARAEEALRKWQALLPILEKPPLSAAHQMTLVEVLKTRQLLAAAARDLNDPASEKARLGELKSMAERLISLEPGHAEYRSMLVHAHWRMAEEKGLGADQVLSILTLAEEQSAALVQRDRSNTVWQMDAAGCAGRLADLARKNADTTGHQRWRALMAERLDRLYGKTDSDIGMLVQLVNYARECARHHLPDDWPTARHHYLAQMDTRKTAAKLQSTGSDLEWATSEMFKVIEQRDGLPAAEKWRAEFQKAK